MAMGIDRLFRQAVDKDNDRIKLVAFVASQGPRQSANEHLVPEQLFDDASTPAKDVEAISAVKALQIATTTGQQIFTITKDNINTVLPLLRHTALVISDIKNATNAGKVVTISQTVISQNGWTGVGYSIIDQQTGAAAYLIGGGADGGFSSLIDGNGNIFSLTAIIPSLSFLDSDTLSRNLVMAKNIFEVYLSQAQAFLDCNKEVVYSFVVAMAIAIAIVFAASADKTKITPLILGNLLLPASALANESLSDKNKVCKNESCPKAETNFHLIKINIGDKKGMVKAHDYKTHYDAVPNKFFDICACEKGAIVIAKGAGKCNISDTIYINTAERWKDPLVPYEY